MPRRRVEFVPGEFYHVYNRGVDRQRIFFERGNYTYFLRKVREYLLGETDRDALSVRVSGAKDVQPTVPDASSVRDSARPVLVVAYCLMPNHYHLLVKLQCTDFSERMAALGKSCTQAINRSRERVGTLFQGRFQAILVDREEYLRHLSRYIHLNPVEARLVTRPGEWEFSSYAEYTGARKGSLPSLEILLGEFGSPQRYREFVDTVGGGVPVGFERYVFEE